jgi:hypothetical protein
MAARQYRSTIESKTLSTGINSSVESMTVNNGETLPNAFPYTLVIDPNLSSEEIVTVNSSSGGGAVLAITRGQDGTSPQSHDASAVIKHMITARDLQDAQNHIEATIGGYTIVNDGQGNTTRSLHGIASGEGAVVGTLKAQTLTNKTLTSPIINGGAPLTVSSTELNQSTLRVQSVAKTANYTIASGDEGSLIKLDATSNAIVVTIPTNTTFAFAIGTQVNLLSTNNTNQISVVGASGVTVDGTPGLVLRARWSSVTLVKIDTNQWIVVGDLV